MYKWFCLFLVIVFFDSLPSRAQENSREAKISWFQSNQILSEGQLDQIAFEDELQENLKSRSYYYVKIEGRQTQSSRLAYLLCDDFLEVSLVISDRLLSGEELRWKVNTLPIILKLPDSLSTKSYFYLRGYNYNERPFPWHGFQWISEDKLNRAFKTLSRDEVLSQVLPNIFATGLIATFILFFGALFISNPSQKVYLHYILFLIPLGIYLFTRSDYVLYHLLGELAVKAPFVILLFYSPTQILIHIAYIVFTLTFLDAKTNFKLYYRAGRILVGACSVFLIIFTIGMYQQPFSLFWLISFYIERLLMTIFGIWVNIYVITYRKDNIALIVSAGSIIFLLGAWGASLYGMNMMRLGAILEVLFFSLGIGYKFRLERKEKDQIKTALIRQLRENDSIQKNYNSALEKEVKVRSEALIEKTKEVEEEKKQKMKAQLENKVEEMKMIALRSQMNPHFLFNSLNSIRHLIIKQKTTEAYDYLSDFASLMRAVLENSEKDAIRLDQELGVIETYISLEELRFKEDFHFQLILGNELNTQQVLVPPLIVQPFLENAIIHGLAPKKANKRLNLNFHIVQQHLVIKIEDNGVGRKTTFQQKTNPANKPMAINIAKDRLNLFVNRYQKGPMLPPKIRIEDKQSTNGIACGTSVYIELPLITIN